MSTINKLIGNKFHLLVAALLCLSMSACSDGEKSVPVKYQLKAVSIWGSSFDPIVEGLQIAVVFESTGEELDYELAIEEENGSFSATGSYVIATDYINMPMAATERKDYNPSFDGEVARVGEDYVFEDPFFDLDFGQLDLNDVRAGKPTLMIEGQELRQSQNFSVSYSDDGSVNYEITSVWVKQ